jgi:hypothetical protein
MPLLILVVLLPLVLMALMPLILVQRYRAGAARRMARSWMATLNVALMAFSAFCFLAGAVVTAVWVPNASRVPQRASPLARAWASLASR